MVRVHWAHDAARVRWVAHVTGDPFGDPKADLAPPHLFIDAPPALDVQ